MLEALPWYNFYSNIVCHIETQHDAACAPRRTIPLWSDAYDRAAWMSWRNVIPSMATDVYVWCLIPTSTADFISFIEIFGIFSIIRLFNLNEFKMHLKESELAWTNIRDSCLTWGRETSCADYQDTLVACDPSISPTEICLKRTFCLLNEYLG